jgi:hypothetical protein
LFATHPFKRGKTIGQFWGRYVVLPINEEYWPLDDAPLFWGCRNCLTAMHPSFQPIIHPKPAVPEVEQVLFPFSFQLISSSVTLSWTHLHLWLGNEWCRCIFLAVVAVQWHTRTQL